MNRVESCKTKYKQLFGDGVPATYATDPDLQDILNHFILGEVFDQGNLDDKQRQDWRTKKLFKLFRIRVNIRESIISFEGILDEKYNNAKETKACLMKLSNYQMVPKFQN